MQLWQRRRTSLLRDHVVAIAFRRVESTIADGFGVYIAETGNLLSRQVVRSCERGTVSVE